MKNHINSSNFSALEKLALWVAEKWSTPFHHSYIITKSSAWAQWRNSKYISNADGWYCETIEQADKHYSWSIGKLSFDQLSERLKAEVASNDNDAAFRTCLDIFDWGGVGSIKRSGASQQWIAGKKNQNKLCKSLEEGVALLHPDSSPEGLSAFNGTDFLMNSSMTKVYAAMNNKIAIYDGRVGAALGLLTRKMLQEHGCNIVPESLQFMWGGEEKRNPSANGYEFKKLPNSSSNKNADFLRAKLSLDTNILIQMICSRINRDKEKKISSLNVERALFMIGYDVSAPVS